MWREQIAKFIEDGIAQPLIVCHECGEASSSPPECGHTASFGLYVLMSLDQIDDPGSAEAPVTTRELKELFRKKPEKGDQQAG